MIKYYFEDFERGQIQQLGSRTITSDEIIAFGTQFDPQPFHVNAEAATDSVFGGLVASGWHTCCLVMKMTCDAFLLETAATGSPGLDQIRWIKPVYAGDTLRAEWITLDAVASRSKPDRGVVHSEWRVFNQREELVMSMRAPTMMLRRPRLA